MKLKLIDLVKLGPERAIEIPEIGSVSVGRSRFADVVVGLEEETVAIDSDSEGSKYLGCVSRNHCTLYVDSSQPYVKDNCSKNGTYINGEQILSDTGTLIEHGDILSLGPYGFQVFFEPSKASLELDRKNDINYSDTIDYIPKKQGN